LASQKSRQKLDLQAAGASLNCDLFNADFPSVVR
jgi:putative FmdB family regulatory protein